MAFTRGDPRRPERDRDPDDDRRYSRRSQTPFAARMISSSLSGLACEPAPSVRHRLPIRHRANTTPRRASAAPLRRVTRNCVRAVRRGVSGGATCARSPRSSAPIRARGRRRPASTDRRRAARSRTSRPAASSRTSTPQRRSPPTQRSEPCEARRDRRLSRPPRAAVAQAALRARRSVGRAALEKRRPSSGRRQRRRSASSAPRDRSGLRRNGASAARAPDPGQRRRRESREQGNGPVH